MAPSPAHPMSQVTAASTEVGTTATRATRPESRRYWRSVSVVAISQAATVSRGVGSAVARHRAICANASPARQAA